MFDMFPKPQYFDKDGHPLDSHDAPGAYWTQVGRIRTRRDGPPQHLIEDAWVAVATPAKT